MKIFSTSYFQVSQSVHSARDEEEGTRGAGGENQECLRSRQADGN